MSLLLLLLRWKRLWWCRLAAAAAITRAGADGRSLEVIARHAAARTGSITALAAWTIRLPVCRCTSHVWAAATWTRAAALWRAAAV